LPRRASPTLSSNASSRRRAAAIVPVASGANRYATPDGAVRFVLDRSGGRAALVQFEGDPEVHVLRPTMGAGGDEIFQTENGDVRLRVTSHGGIIVYTRAMRTGAAASEEGRVAPLTPEQLAFAEMQTLPRAAKGACAPQCRSAGDVHCAGADVAASRRRRD
jgi:hypothetical protein